MTTPPEDGALVELEPTVVVHVLQQVQAMAQQLNQNQQALLQHQQTVAARIQQQAQDAILAQQRQFKFQPPKPFSGKDEEFEAFATKFKGFMGS